MIDEKGRCCDMARGLFAPGDIVQHRNGGTYKIVGRCTIEATLEDCYAYRCEGGRLWIRPAKEMEDGRFTLVS
jgi:hypothetical protein